LRRNRALEETVPLSEEELRLLEQMERALVAEDPKFASTLRGTRMRQHARRQMVLGVLVFVVGIGMLMTGAIYKTYPVAVLGFVVMLGSAYLTLIAWRGQNRAPLQGEQQQHPAGGDQPLRVIDGGKVRRTRPSRQPKAAKPPKPQGSMMERFEERWRRRREQNGGF
jgi:hypothetical protein